MKKLVSVFLIGLISLFITGCSLLLKEEKKEETKPAPKQEQVQQTKPQDENSTKADSALDDSKPLEVDSLTIYVDDRTWAPQPKNGGYEMFPDADSFEQSLEGVLVKVEQVPFPRDEDEKQMIVDMFLRGMSSKVDDVNYKTLKSESDEIMIRFQAKKNGVVGEGFLRVFGNQKTAFVVYLNMKNTSEEEMEKWQKRIEAATFADSL